MLRVILSESPHGGGDRALTLHCKGQWFDPWCWQLEKVANLTKVMDSHKNHKVQMTKWLEWTVHVVHLVQPVCDLYERHTFAKHKKIQ